MRQSFMASGGGAVFVLVAFDALVVDEVGYIEENFAFSRAFAGDLFGDGQKHSVHLDLKCSCLGLAFALCGGRFAEAAQVFLAHTVREDLA